MTEKEFNYFDSYLVKMVFSSGRIASGYVFDIPNEEKKISTEFSFVDYIDAIPFIEAHNKKNKKLAKEYQVPIDVTDVVTVVHLNYEEVLQNVRDDIQKLEIPNDEPFKTRIWAKIAKLIYANFGPKSPFLEDLRQKQLLYPTTKFYGKNSKYLNKDFLKPYKNSLLEFLMILEATIENSSNYSRDLESYDPDDTSPVLNGVPDFTTDKNNHVGEEKPIYKTKKKKRKTEAHVFIASPSDVKEARHALLNMLETQWRRLHFEENSGMRLIVHGWEELPSQTGHPQSIITNRLVKDMDVIVAVFKYTLGTPVNDPVTGDVRAESGTVEELMYAIQNSTKESGPMGMAYFESKGPAWPVESADYDNNIAEYKRLKKFKSEIGDKILYKPYAEENDLLQIVCSDLYNNIIQKYGSAKGKRFQILQ